MGSSRSPAPWKSRDWIGRILESPVCRRLESAVRPKGPDGLEAAMGCGTAAGLEVDARFEIAVNVGFIGRSSD
ncbi:hypothetical protein EA462_10785 [Natrarchaeobius halalkaliphilus]|uniref:Uncharacterized protein n=1 Tax=Natrarchaeobius halalkaliphilus TaxID=1679091 RepID=A0A3N6P1D6_9EURY|nr:hypothetical protein EA462_10785 [Natrarchaeobius halalkaliphilus]